MSTGVTVDALGVPIGVDADLADLLPHLRRRDDEPAGTVAPMDTRAGVRELTRLAVEHTTLLVVHAGVVATHRGVIAFPAVSGAGKSTLTAACTAAGFEYVCDEVLALDRSTGEVIGFPRPLAMAHASRVLVGLADDDDDERFVDPATLGALARNPPGRLRHVVLPSRTGGRAVLRPVDGATAFAALLPRCFNHFRSPVNTWQVLAEVSREAQGHTATYGDARELAQLLLDLDGRDAAVGA